MSARKQEKQRPLLAGVTLIPAVFVSLSDPDIGPGKVRQSHVTCTSSDLVTYHFIGNWGFMTGHLAS